MKNQNSKASVLINLLKSSRDNLSLKRILSGIFLSASLFSTGFLLISWLESTFYFPAIVKTPALLILLSIAVITGVYLLKKYPPVSLQKFYLTFFRSSGKPELLHAVDLAMEEEKRDSPFYRLAIEKNLEKENFETLKKELNGFLKGRAVHRIAMFSSAWLAVSVLGGILFFLSSDAVTRTLSFWKDYEKPNPYQFTLQPGSAIVEHGSEFAPVITFEGDTPGKLFLALKTGIEEEFRLRPLRQTDEEFSFTSQPVELTADADYKIIMDEFESQVHKIEVQLRPRFDSLVATVQPPAYTGLSSDNYTYPFTTIPAYEGSEVQIEASSNKPVSQAEIFFSGKKEIFNLNGEGENNSFSYAFTVASADTIRFHLTDKDSLTNRNPFRFAVDMKEDEAPSALIREPENEKTVVDPKTLGIIYTATDDFGLTRARLEWEINRPYVNEPEKGSIELNKPGIGTTELVEWNLVDLDLRPRDEVTYRVRVWDNDGINGSKSGTSQEMKLSIPSMTAFFDEIDSKERDVQNDIDDISGNYDEMQNQYQELLENLKQNRDIGWDEQQNVRELEESQKKIEETFQNLNEEFEELREQIEESNYMSESTMKAYRELQELMEDLDDPALREAMEELRRSMENMNQRQIEQALQNLQFNEEVYRERLKRTAELFKTVKMNSDLDKLAKQFEEMAENLEKTEEEGNRLEDLKNELESGNEDLEKIREQIENLTKNPPERFQKKLEELQNSSGQNAEEMQQELQEMMDEAEQQMQEGRPNPGEQLDQQRDQMARQMRQQSRQMQQAMQQMSGQQIQVNLLALQRALYTLIELSQSQESLTQHTSEVENRSQAFIELAREQKNISDQFSHVADTLFQISSEIPGLSNQVNLLKSEVEKDLSQATDQMAERDRRRANIAARESMGGINNLASMIASLIDQLSNQQQGGGGGGTMSMQQMIEQMQQMSGEQQMLNEQMQQLINDVQGDRLTKEQSERLDQLARQQNEIRKKLQELQQSGALKQGDRALSEMQRMIEDMEDSINDMRGGMTDPLMEERQQNILSRMLNAEKSLQERGEDEERKGERPQDFDRAIPPDITLEELKQEIRTRLQDPDYTRFRQDYQRMIERYFELLRRMEGVPQS